MISKKDIIAKAEELGFDDTGFTTAEPFPDHEALLNRFEEEYAWAEKAGLDLKTGVNPKSILPEAKSIIVLIEPYFRHSFPHSMESHFGRCYLDDDRVTRDGLAKRLKAFRSFLRDKGIDSKVPFNLPHRVAAARSGLGTFGKNCLFYSRKTARQGSWTLPIAVVIDAEFTPDKPTIGNGCPDWCRNACIAACPTRALKGNSRIDPRQCVSWLTYFGNEITPYELREPMGLYIYGCDRCQNVCPRNQAWLSSELPANRKAQAKEKDFSLLRLLHMDRDYFESRIWPHMFYMGSDQLWKWKMNVARVIGNTRDSGYINELVKAFKENDDDRVRGMIIWAAGRIGGPDAASFLNDLNEIDSAPLQKEVALARSMIKQSISLT